jgi:photosystem II stability/assembly factor-like uncharacterized protein
MKKLLLASLCFLFFCEMLAQDWIIQHPFSIVETMMDVEILPDGKGYAVGEGGLILVTSDFGEQWNIKETPHSSPYRFVHSMSGTNGQIVLAGGQKMARSTDFGETWVAIEPSLDNIQSFHSLDQNIVFLTTIQRGVYKSTDGGENWIKFDNIPGENHEDVYFFDEQNGIVCARFDGMYKFIHTNDGGNSWNEMNEEYLFLQRMDFASNLIGFAAGPEMVLKTIDGGASWTPIPGSPSCNEIVAINENVIWALRGLGYEVSLDGGESWTFSSPNGGGNTQGIFAVDQQNIWITQANTSIKRTTDGGENWVDQVGGPKGAFEALDMLDGDFGIAGSGDYITKTDDGGAVWEPIFVKENLIITEAHIIDRQNMLLSGRKGLVRSTNGGDNWSDISNLDGWYTTFHYLSNNRIILGTIQGDIWISNIDGSQTSMIQNLGSQINSIDFINDSKGFAITRNGLIYRTTNAGDSWDQVFDEGGEISAIYALSDHIIFAAKRFGDLILRSNDGGDTWSDINVSTSTFWNDFVFYDEMNGYLVGGSATQGRILKTGDAGLTWETDFSNSTAFERADAPLAGERLIWAAGNGGLIVRFSECNLTPKLNALNVQDLICSNDTVSLEVDFEGVDIFEWTVSSDFTIIGNDGSARIDLLIGNTSGTVSVKGLNSCGDETQSLSIELSPIANPIPTVSQDGSVLSCETNAQSYQWYLDDQAISGATNPQYLASVSGAYYVIITSANGCISMPSMAIDIIASATNDIDFFGIEVFPNPVNQELNVIGLHENDQLEIYSSEGKLVRSLEGAFSSYHIEELASGLYFLRIQRRDKQGVIKIFKM